MDTYGIVVLVAGAIVIGLGIEALVTSLLGELRIGYEVLLTMIGAGVGAFVASEYLGAASEWGYEFEGMFVFPAIIGALVVGLIVEAVVRYAVRPTARA